MGFAAGVNAGANLRQQREARLQLKQQRDEELLRLGYSFENGQMQTRPDSAAEAEQLQFKEAAQLAKALQAKLLQNETDKAFEDFSLTGDATYLQSALDKNPELKKAWANRGVQLVGNIDFDNDRSVLERAGMPESYYDTEEKRSTIRKNMYKVYDGKDWTVGLANKAMAETGVLSRLGQRRAQPMVDNYQSFYDMLNGPKVSLYTAEGHKYEKQILAAAEKYELPPNLIAAQMAKESSNNPNAVSNKGASGLMQLMPATAQELGVTDIMDPDQNIDAGAKYMRKMLDKYGGDTRLALAAYNAGPGNVDKYGGIPPFGETQDYVSKIMANLDQGEQYYGRSADDTINTIANYYRTMANAKQGTTNENVDTATRNDTRRLDLTSRQLDQEDTKIAQKDKELAVKLATEGTTTKQKDLAAADDFTNELVTMYGGEDKFFATDFSDPKEYNKAYRQIVKIEQLEGTELSEADKKKIGDIRKLIALGDPAKELTGAETGLVDKTLGDLNKFLSDEVKGAKAKSTYAAFRNSVRNALFGSALTEAEIKSFNEAYGTLGNKLGPVLAQFETSLMQVQAELDSVSNLMNPYSAKVRLGADQEKLLKIRDALQARVDYIQGLQNPGQTKVPASDRPSLENIFGGE